MATADPELDPTTLNEPGATGGGDYDGDDTNYMSPITTKTSTTRVDPDIEETSFIDDTNEKRRLLEEKEEDREYAETEIKRFFPRAKTSNFIAGVRKSFVEGVERVERIFLKLKRKGSREYTLLKDGEFDGKLPQTLKDSLGPRAEVIVEANDDQIVKKKTSKGRPMMKCKCASCGITKTRFLSEAKYRNLKGANE